MHFDSEALILEKGSWFIVHDHAATHSAAVMKSSWQIMELSAIHLIQLTCFYSLQENILK
jgi:hypothetical protein